MLEKVFVWKPPEPPILSFVVNKDITNNRQALLLVHANVKYEFVCALDQQLISLKPFLYFG